LIDFHCHLDLYPDPAAIVAECTKRHLFVLSVTTVPSAFVGTETFAVGNERIHTALGLHPEVAVARRQEMALFEKMIGRTQYVGEVGLDGSGDHRATLDVQAEILSHILSLCSDNGGRIISLHSRGAIPRLLNLMESYLYAGELVLHWFNGSAKQVAHAAEMGAWFSVGPTMLASKRGREAVSHMPRDRILTESDGPFSQIDGASTNPWQAWLAVANLSELWQEDRYAVERQLIKNLATITSFIPERS
jgi:TatD DNase family protein